MRFNREQPRRINHSLVSATELRQGFQIRLPETETSTRFSHVKPILEKLNQEIKQR